MNMRIVTTALCGGLMLLVGTSVRADEEKKEEPKVEVVFCLDTTGSMSGLIEGAKQKIWAISNQILSGKPVPDLKIGLVGYRDRKDAYVTKVTDLTDDLDAIHGELKKFQAGGGGDTPESVNQALHEAVTKIKWSADDKTLKIIFLVGDAPPHMDYKDDVKYPETCQLAMKKHLIINTIQCGNLAGTGETWQDIAKKAEGDYVRIAQSGGVVAVATPFDKKLAELNSRSARTIVVYGEAEKRRRDKAKAEDAAELKPGAESAGRAGSAAKGGRAASFDLVDAVRENRVQLEELTEKELPENLRKMKPEELKQHFAKIEKERAEINKEILELDKKRNEFIKKKLAEDKLDTKNSFDSQVLEMLRKQAKKHKIDY